MNRSRKTARLGWQVVLCAVLWTRGFTTVGLAQTVVLSPLDVKDVVFPRIRLLQTGNDNHPPYAWNVSGDDSGFLIRDEAGVSTTPFFIQPSTPHNALVLSPNGLGSSTIVPNCAVGIGGTPSGTCVNLQLFNNNTAKMRLTRTFNGVGIYHWDVAANKDTFYVEDNTGSKTPLLINSGAPTSSLYVSKTGSIGLGTATPNVLGSANLPGQVSNLVSLNNRATLAAQGAVGACLTLAHGNGPANQRILQLKQINGIAFLDVLLDNLAVGVPNVLNIRMADGHLGFGIGADSVKPLKMKSGAFVSTGGVWTNASSRKVKQDIEPLTLEQARSTVQALKPVGFRYKEEPTEHYVGFIAEDVPELVATNDRASLAPMDIVGVLTKVVQDQDAQIKRLTKRLDDLEHKLIATVSTGQ